MHRGTQHGILLDDPHGMRARPKRIRPESREVWRARRPAATGNSRPGEQARPSASKGRRGDLYPAE
jgi:hypothetical protein